MPPAGPAGSAARATAGSPACSGTPTHATSIIWTAARDRNQRGQILKRKNTSERRRKDAEEEQGREQTRGRREGKFKRKKGGKIQAKEKE